MTALENVKLILGSDAPDDNTINGYLDFGTEAILNRMYVVADRPEEATLPTKYTQILIQATVDAIGQRGGEGESAHTEGDVSRNFNYATMIDFINSKVLPIIG